MALAQPPDTMWTRTYPNASNALSMAATPDGGFIISQWVNFPYDASLLKIDSLGNVEWEHTYGDPETSELFADAKPCPSGGYVAVGHRYGFPTYNDPEIYVVRTNGLGDTLWTRTLNVQDRDDLSAVELTDNGDLICVGQAGYVGPNSNAGDALIMRYTNTGDLVWLRRYRRELSSWAEDVARSGSDKFIVGGQTGQDWADDSSRAYLLSIDGVGDTLWTNTYGMDTFNRCHAISATEDGGFAFTGATTSEPANPSDLLVMRGDSLGNLIWENQFEYGHSGWGIQRASQGGFAVFYATRPLPGVGFQYGLQRLTSYGDTLWTGIYGTSGDDYVSTGLELPNNGYVMLGLNSGVYVVRTLPEPMTTSEPRLTSPSSAVLLSAYPNPLNLSTTISYSLPAPVSVRLSLYDILGREVQSTSAALLSPGIYHVLFDAGALSSGTYFMQLDAGKEVQTVKLLLQK